MDLSPDEQTMAVCRGAFGTSRDIWLVDAASGRTARSRSILTTTAARSSRPTAADRLQSDRRCEGAVPEGRGRSGARNCWSRRGTWLSAEAWSADGRFIRQRRVPGQSHDVFLLPLAPAGDASPIAFLATPATETEARWPRTAATWPITPASPECPRQPGPSRCTCARSPRRAGRDRGNGGLLDERGLWPHFEPRRAGALFPRRTDDLGSRRARRRPDFRLRRAARSGYPSGGRRYPSST